MPHILSMRRNLEILHVGFQDLHLNAWEAEHGPVVVDELPDERGGAPQALRLFFDGGGFPAMSPRQLEAGDPSGLAFVYVCTYTG